MAAYDYASGGFPTSPVTNDTLAVNGTNYTYNGSAWEVVGGDGEGTSILSTGEIGGTKYLREDGDGTCSWQAVAAGGGASDINGLTDGYTDSSNIGLGGSFNSITSGGANVLVGRGFTLPAITSGSNNVAIGHAASRYVNTGSGNIAIGSSASNQNRSGTGNVSIGSYTNFYTYNTSNNIAIGDYTLFRGKGNHNTALGYHAMKGAVGNLTGAYNTGIGYQAGYSLSTGQYNILNGYQAGYALTSGLHNVFLGESAGNAQTIASENNAIGHLSLGRNVTGNNNNAFGALTLVGGTGISFSSCSAFGHQALMGNKGDYNSAFGSLALNSVTTGTKNIGIGYGAGDAITTGSNNTIIGDYAGTAALSDTVAIYAGITERLKVDASGLTVNGAAIGGKVLQVKYDDIQPAIHYSSSASGYIDTELSVTITPVSSTSIMLISYVMGSQVVGEYVFHRIAKNGLGFKDELWSAGISESVGKYVDDHNTTSAITYKVQVNPRGYLYYYHHDSRNSTLTITEVEV